MRGHTRLAAAVTGVMAAAGLLAIAVPSVEARAAVKTRASAPSGVAAPWAELANAATGADLWSRDSTAQRPMGSIAKVMTAYVVIEAGGLNRVFTVPKGITGYDDKYGASTAGLVPGNRYTALQLLYALLIPSGRDRHQDRADRRGRGLPAVRGAARLEDPDRRRAALLHELHEPYPSVQRRDEDAQLGIRAVTPQ